MKRFFFSYPHRFDIDAQYINFTYMGTLLLPATSIFIVTHARAPSCLSAIYRELKRKRTRG